MHWSDAAVGAGRSLSLRDADSPAVFYNNEIDGSASGQTFHAFTTVLPLSEGSRYQILAQQNTGATEGIRFAAATGLDIVWVAPI